MTTLQAVGRGVGTGLRWTGRGLRYGLSEVWWWIGGALRFLIRAPGRAVAWTAGTVYSYLSQTWLLLTALTVVALVPAVWATGWPGSYQQHVVHPAWRRRIRRSVRKSWAGLMEACGLA